MALSESDIENKRLIDWLNKKERQKVNAAWGVQDPEPEPDLEFKAQHFCLETYTEIGRAAANIENLLNDGWQIDEKIICPPYGIIIFSREKESNEDAREET